MGDGFLDEFEAELEDEEGNDEYLDGEVDSLTVESGGESDDPEASEAEARAEASAKADEVLHEFNGESDEPPYPSRDDRDALKVWAEWIAKSLDERAAERAAIEAVFEAEEAAASTEADVEELEPVDFSTWDTGSFTELVDRVSGSVPRGAPRVAVGDNEFERALALMEG